MLDAKYEAVLAALAEAEASVPPVDWEWFNEEWGDYEGYPGIVSGGDISNSGDVHDHGIVVGQWLLVHKLRVAVDAAEREERRVLAV